MKKITALVLALGLAVPAQACHLFPVREKIVTVKETNYKVTAVTGAVTLLAGLAVIGYVYHKNQNLINDLDTKKIQNTHLRGRINELEHDKITLSNTAAQRGTRITALQADLEKKDTDHAQELADINERLANCRTGLQDEIDKRMQLEESWTISNTARMKANEENERLKAEITDLQKQVQRLAQSNKTLQSQIDGSAAKGLQHRIDELQTKLATAQKDAQDNLRRALMAEAEIKNLQHDVSVLRKDTRGKDVLIANMKGTIDSLTNELEAGQ